MQWYYGYFFALRTLTHLRPQHLIVVCSSDCDCTSHHLPPRSRSAAQDAVAVVAVLLHSQAVIHSTEADIHAVVDMPAAGDIPAVEEIPAVVDIPAAGGIPAVVVVDIPNIRAVGHVVSPRNILAGDIPAVGIRTAVEHWQSQVAEAPVTQTCRFSFL